MIFDGVDEDVDDDGVYDADGDVAWLHLIVKSDDDVCCDVRRRRLVATTIVRKPGGDVDV